MPIEDHTTHRAMGQTIVARSTLRSGSELKPASRSSPRCRHVHTIGNAAEKGHTDRAFVSHLSTIIISRRLTRMSLVNGLHDCRPEAPHHVPRKERRRSPGALDAGRIRPRLTHWRRRAEVTGSPKRPASSGAGAAGWRLHSPSTRAGPGYSWGWACQAVARHTSTAPPSTVSIPAPQSGQRSWVGGRNPIRSAIFR